MFSVSIALTLAQSGPASSVQIGSIWDFIVKGGPVMIPIGITSLVALTVFIERCISLRRSRIIPPGFRGGLESRFGPRRDIAAALDYCKALPSPLANVFAAAVRRSSESIERQEQAVTHAGEREVASLRKYLRILALVAAIAPLLGLLGTITGMIQAFSTVASSAEALGRTELLARGIYEAMITTAAGLIVAIPTIIAHHYLAARVDRLVLDIDLQVGEFLESQRSPVARSEGRPAIPALEPRSNGSASLPPARSDDAVSNGPLLSAAIDHNI